MTTLARMEAALGERRRANDHPVAVWTLGGKFFTRDGAEYLGDDLRSAKPAIEVAPARTAVPKPMRPAPKAKKRGRR